MDLGTVKVKMDQRKYSTPDEFAFDVRLIFKNCYTYNPETHDVVAMAKKLEGVFEDKFKRCPPDIKDEDFDEFDPPALQVLSPPKAKAKSALTSPAIKAAPPKATASVPASSAPTTVVAPTFGDSDSDSEDGERAKMEWNQRLMHVQEQMKQLNEQIKILVQESAARKKRKMDKGEGQSGQWDLFLFRGVYILSPMYLAEWQERSESQILTVPIL